MSVIASELPVVSGIATVTARSATSLATVTARRATDVAAAASGRSQCSTCHLRELCVPSGMTRSDLERLDGLRFMRRKLRAGQTLYQDGDVFRHIYAVRSGTLKSSLMLADGREQVSGFHLAGEVVGLDGLAGGLHASTTMALEDSETCVIPYGALTQPDGDGGMQRMVTRLMSREILREHRLMLLLGSMTAEERVAAFLLNLSQRYAALGYSPIEFNLRMSRAEIGSYLGVKLETVSRTFSIFQQQELLDVQWRRIRIADLEGLKRRFGSPLP